MLLVLLLLLSLRSPLLLRPTPLAPQGTKHLHLCAAVSTSHHCKEDGSPASHRPPIACTRCTICVHLHCSHLHPVRSKRPRIPTCGDVRGIAPAGLNVPSARVAANVPKAQTPPPLQGTDEVLH